MGAKTAEVLARLVARAGSQTAVWSACGIDDGFFSRLCGGSEDMGANTLAKIIAVYPDVEADLVAAIKADVVHSAGVPKAPLKNWVAISEASRLLATSAGRAHADEVSAMLTRMAGVPWVRLSAEMNTVLARLERALNGGGGAVGQ